MKTTQAIAMTKATKDFGGMRVLDDVPVEENLPSDYLRIEMASSRINPADLDLMSGAMPFLSYKTPIQVGGVDGAGTITEVGSNVEGLAVGDQVFFSRYFTDIGTWAKEMTIPSKWAAKIPSNISLQDAGAIALTSLTAYDSLKSFGEDVKPGESIFIHGGAGGVGLQATQLALLKGLKVTVTASAKDADMLKSLGVSRVIDYRTEKFEEVLSVGEVDYIFDAAGKEKVAKSIDLKPRKIVSIAVPDATKMAKMGVELGWIWKQLFGMVTFFDMRLAKKAGVELIGQVTGPDAGLMDEYVSLIASKGSDYKIPKTKWLTLDEIRDQGMSAKDVGKVIKFQ